jgi:hypothetical protein
MSHTNREAHESSLMTPSPYDGDTSPAKLGRTGQR